MATPVSSPPKAPSPAATRPARAFPWAPLLVLAVVGLLFAGLIGEIATRAAALRWTQFTHGQCVGARGFLEGQKGLFRLDPAAGYTMNPNLCVRLRSREYDEVLVTNARGMVGPDVPDARPPDEFRVVVLGDSYTAGGQVPYERNFTALLEARLRAAGVTNPRVVNAGVGGYSTFNEAGLLRENLDWLQPDLVVVAAFLGNDVGENVLATYGGYRDAPEHPKGVTWNREASDLLAASDGWFPRNPPPVAPSGGGLAAARAPLSGARATAQRAWDQARAASRLLGTLFGDPIHDLEVTTAPGGAPPSATQRHLNVSSFEWTILRDQPREPHLDAAWPLFGRYLADVRATAASVGAPTLLLAIPDMAQFDDAMRARVMADYRFREDEVDWDRPQRDLRAQADAAGLPMLDLLPLFRARADRADLYLRLDTHFSALGHAATADALAEAVLPYARHAPAGAGRAG